MLLFTVILSLYCLQEIYGSTSSKLYAHQCTSLIRLNLWPQSKKLIFKGPIVYEPIKIFF